LKKLNWSNKYFILTKNRTNYDEENISSSNTGKYTHMQINNGRDKKKLKFR